MEVLILLVIGGLGIGLAGAISIAWLNPGNKTIAISAAALFGAAFLFFIQLIFELRATEEKNIIPAGLIIDRAGSESGVPEHRVIRIRGHLPCGNHGKTMPTTGYEQTILMCLRRM